MTCEAVRMNETSEFLFISNDEEYLPGDCDFLFPLIYTQKCILFPN